MKLKYATFAMIVIGCFANRGMNARADDAPTQPATTQATTASSPQMQDLRAHAAKLQADLEAANAVLTHQTIVLRDLDLQLRTKMGRMDVLPAHIRDAAASLDTQVDALRLAQVGTQARRDAIAEQIAELGQRVTNGIARDEAVVALEKVVQSREMAFKTIVEQHNAGVISQNDVDAAQTALAEAQAQVALERNRAAASAGGDIVVALQRELIDQTITQSAQDGQLRFLAAEQERFRQGMDILAVTEQTRREIEGTSSQIQETRSELDATNFQIEHQPR